MNLEIRKLKFIQDFLKVQSEETISRLEKILKKEGLFLEEHPFDTITEEELNKIINQSESDFQNDRFKNSSELLAKYE